MKQLLTITLLLLCSSLVAARTHKDNKVFSTSSLTDSVEEEVLIINSAKTLNADEDGDFCRSNLSQRDGSRRFVKSPITQPQPALYSGNTKLSLTPQEVKLSLLDSGRPSGLFLAPIRTSSPAVTVYHGGVIKPRYTFTSRELGDLKADFHALEMTVTYGAAAKIELEADLSFQKTTFDDGENTGTQNSLGNVTLWGKYRFFRTMETWGHSQAAIRFGIGLPTTKKTLGKTVNVNEFVAQQLTANTGGVSFSSDASYSQAKNRFIFGGNIAGQMRTERDGYRLGNEVRVNTDLEFIVFPLKYDNPTKEVYAILETNFVHRRNGKFNGVTIPGSNSTEFYLSPAIQYNATTQFVLEASVQLPVINNGGPLMLQTNRSVMIGFRYLY